MRKSRTLVEPSVFCVPYFFSSPSAGEITLRGNVLPVGGVKEKVLAALRARVSTIILPQPNQRDLEEVPAELSKDVKFVFVEHVRQVFREALISQETPRPTATGKRAAAKKTA